MSGHDVFTQLAQSQWRREHVDGNLHIGICPASREFVGGDQHGTEGAQAGIVGYGIGSVDHCVVYHGERSVV